MDDLETQKKFAQSLKLPFPLAADPNGDAAGAYGVKKGSHASRATFVIDPEGKVMKVVEGSDALDPDSALQACPLHKPKT
jgi:thioredoxin-dependent peroxiredoxin